MRDSCLPSKRYCRTSSHATACRAPVTLLVASHVNVPLCVPHQTDPLRQIPLCQYLGAASTQCCQFGAKTFWKICIGKKNLHVFPDSPRIYLIHRHHVCPMRQTALRYVHTVSMSESASISTSVFMAFTTFTLNQNF